MKTLLCSLLALVVVGCDVGPTSLPVEETEIWGVYMSNFGAGLRETIELRSDKTYTYYFKGQDGKEVTITDQLAFGYNDTKKERPYVGLINYISPYPLHASCYCTDPKLGQVDTSRYIYIMEVFKRTSGQVVLVRCPDVNQYYLKQGP